MTRPGEDNINASHKALQEALQPLEAELDQWQAIDQVATFWWRDDDANQPSLFLDQLLQASLVHKIPLALATIPRAVSQHIVRQVSRTPTVTVLQHGFSHNNYAPMGEKNMELGLARELDVVCSELKQGWRSLNESFGEQFLPVLVPPWNRVADEVVAELPTLGFIGYSTFGTVAMDSTAKINNIQANMHVDIIDWRNTRKTFPYENIVAQLVSHLQARRMKNREGKGKVPLNEATGFMTHHLVHDEQAWLFIDALFGLCREHESAQWISSRSIFLDS